MRGDAVRLRQILMNLIGNAVKFTEEGDIVVRASLVAADAETAELRFEVADTGPGITPEQQAQIFEPFSQLISRRGDKPIGTGLGLSISRRLAELMGGTVGVSSQLGQGSRFWLTVRLACVDAAPVQTELPRLPACRVLVVDDHEPSRSVVRQWLGSWDMACDEVDSAAAALYLLRKPAGASAYDVLIVDQTMAGVTGSDFLRLLRGDDRLRDVRAVLLVPTVSRPPSDLVSAEAADLVLTKPLRESALLNALVTLVTPESERPAPADGADHQQAAGQAGPPTTDLAAAGSGRPGAGARILVVEDSAINREVALGILATLGYEADVATNGLEAVQMAAKAPYATILMDCQMPYMDGYEATAEIRRQERGHRRIPIVAMTAHAMQGSRERCIAAGMDDYLSKPVRRRDVERMLARWARPRTDSQIPDSALDPVELTPRPAGAVRLMAVDAEAIADLRELQREGLPDVVAELAEQFAGHAPELLTALKEAVAADDREQAIFNAHTLKGNAAVWGAQRLTAACQRLEDAARVSQEPLEELVAEVNALLLDVLADLVNLSRGLAA